MFDFNLIDKVWNKKLSRKEFLSKCVKFGIGAGASLYLFDFLDRYKAYASIGEKRGMHKALHYEKIGKDAVRCVLCDNYCVLKDGQRGFCRVREAVKGELYSLVYELVCSVHVDPIEKKPLFHVLPGTRAFSVATAGCNSRCKFCQNWTISQRPPEETYNQRLTCKNLVRSAKNQRCASIAYTYSEPIVFYEYVMDSGRIAKENGILNILVTGGKINPDPLKGLCQVADAANVDLKGFNPKYLKDVCGQNLDNILETLIILKEQGVWVEITNLIVPTMNDKMDEIRKMVRWVRNNLGKDVPIHFSRFWPQYKLRSLYPTPVETLRKARDIGLEEGLHYVYIGNVPEKGAESTKCPKCKRTIIDRIGYQVKKIEMTGGKCAYCGEPIAGIWK